MNLCGVSSLAYQGYKTWNAIPSPIKHIANKHKTFYKKIQRTTASGNSRITY